MHFLTLLVPGRAVCIHRCNKCSSGSYGIVTVTISSHFPCGPRVFSCWTAQGCIFQTPPRCSDWCGFWNNHSGLQWEELVRQLLVLHFFQHPHSHTETRPNTYCRPVQTVQTALIWLRFWEFSKIKTCKNQMHICKLSSVPLTGATSNLNRLGRTLTEGRLVGKLYFSCWPETTFFFFWESSNLHPPAAWCCI